ncbi:Delta-aminolevulinic acid dehydratase [compost metagenome]|jgi:porphobilinogen synthase
MSTFPVTRPWRLRRNESLRTLFQETEFRLEALILPSFIEEGIEDFVPHYQHDWRQVYPRKAASSRN